MIAASNFSLQDHYTIKHTGRENKGDDHVLQFNRILYEYWCLIKGINGFLIVEI